MKRILLITICVSVSITNIAYAQRVKKTSFICQFTDSFESSNKKYTKFNNKNSLYMSFTITELNNRGVGYAIMRANNGVSEVTTLTNGTYTSFLEFLGIGGIVQTTTVYPDGSAIHSRHSPSPASNFNTHMASQWYGSCVLQSN